MITTTGSEYETRYVSMEQGYQQVFARNAGLFEPLIWPGNEVTQGQTIAYLHDPTMPGYEPESIVAEADGTVLCYRVMAQTKRGDCLFEIVDKQRDT